MSTLPTITEEEIEDRVGPQSFERGQGYFARHMIFDGRRQGMRLKARCHGSQPAPYRVEVTFDAEGIADADCSCPVGGGGYCKHVAALLLTWQAKPEAFPEVEDLAAALERRSKAELIAIIQQMLRREPELEWLVEAPLPAAGKTHAAVDPETFRRQAEAAFGRFDLTEWGAIGDVSGDLETILEIGDGFLDQENYAAAAGVYGAVAQAVMKHFEPYLDENGELSCVCGGCIVGLRDCLESDEEGTLPRETILRTLFDLYRRHIEAGGVGFGEGASGVILDQSTPEECRMVAGWVREVLPEAGRDWAKEAFGGFLLNLEAETLDDDAFLRICRETGRIEDLVERLLALGRLEEAVTEAEKAGDYVLMRLADRFAAHGHEEVAEGMVVLRSEKSQDYRLQVWLKNRYTARGDTAAALEIAQQLYDTQPSLDRYQEIREFARALGQWESTRPKLLDALEDSWKSNLRIEIYLDEGEIDQALAALRSRPKSPFSHLYTGGIQLDVAQAAEATHPRESLAIYQQHVDRLIAGRGRGNYQVACSFLARIRALYQKLGETAEWDRYISQLRQSNRALRALKEELATAKL